MRFDAIILNNWINSLESVKLSHLTMLISHDSTK